MSALNTLLILGTAFLGVFLEAAFDAPRRLLGAQVDCLPALMVYAALTSNLATVAGLALVGGLAFDSLSANPLGVTVGPLLGAGVLILRFRHLLLSREVYAQWLLGLGASAAVPLATVLLLMAMGTGPGVGWGSAWQWLVVAAAGSAMVPLFFGLFERLRGLFGYRPVQESSFRPDREIARRRRRTPLA